MFNAKNLIKFLLGVFMFVSFSGCVSIEENEYVVWKYQPWFFGSGGLDMKEVSEVGLEYTWPSTSAIRMDKYPYELKITFDDLITADNNPVDFDMYIEFQNIKEGLPELVAKHGVDWYKRQIRKPTTEFTRDLASKEEMFTLTTKREKAKEISASVLTYIRTLLVEKDINVQCNRVTISAVTPPADVIAETIRTAAQVQREKTESAAAAAELARKEREKNKALADGAYRKGMGMNNDQYLKVREIEMVEGKGDNVTIIWGAGALPTVPLR